MEWCINLVTDPINNILSKAYLMLFLIIQVLKQFMCMDGAVIILTTVPFLYD